MHRYYQYVLRLHLTKHTSSIMRHVSTTLNNRFISERWHSAEHLLLQSQLPIKLFNKMMC